MSTTFYWHDYETWGANPAVDRAAQFAGVRTDMELNIIGEPTVIYCQPPADILPHPQACLITGIAPQKALNEGLREVDFFARIHAELALPGTLGVGYNSIRFDDEVTRYGLYRNFYDPYEREWANGNGRWDIIDLTRLCYALRPDGINWPTVDGKPSFRLELLTEANGISHGRAHDAYADVEATIAFARLLKQAQPDVYNYALQNRPKAAVQKLIDWGNRSALLHVSSKIPAERACATLVMPLAPHPTNKNAIIVYDLAQDPSSLLELDATAIKERVFASQEQLAGEGRERIALKTVHLNRCPILATAKLVNEQVAARLQLDLQACRRHWQSLKAADVTKKVQEVMGGGEFAQDRDAEQALYAGFIDNKDKSVMEQVRSADAETLAAHNFAFRDKRLNELLWRYKARNFPAALSEQERQMWFELCRSRLRGEEPEIQSIAQVQQCIRELDAEQELNKEQKIVLQQLYRYTSDMERQSQLGAKCRW